MATGESQNISDKEIPISHLAAAISAQNMEAIAERYLSIDAATVRNIHYDNRWNAEAFNREILRHWAYKNHGPDQIKVMYAWRIFKFSLVSLTLSVLFGHFPNTKNLNVYSIEGRIKDLSYEGEPTSEKGHQPNAFYILHFLKYP